MIHHEWNGGRMSEQWELVIKGGQVVTPTGVVTADVGIAAGRITTVAPNQSAQRIIDATGRLILPGGIDPHCHIEQMSGMGLMNADTFETATRSAAMGGTTSVISFCAQAKEQRLHDAMADYTARAARGALVDHAFHIIISDTAVPHFTQDLMALMAAGHRSIKIFTTYNIALNDRQILEVLAMAKAGGALTCVHAENDALIGFAKDRLIAAGHTRPHHHALSHPRMAELEAVERMCRFAEFLDAPLMLFHISTAEALAPIRAAQARGVPVVAETCPHYLFMEADVLDKPGLEGAKFMCSPPQRTPPDQVALWDALADGTLSVVSSDHAPYRYDATGKLSNGPDAPFQDIANGLPGLEARLPLMFDAMVSRGKGGVEAFARITAEAPARLYGLNTKGRIAPGYDADLVIWNPDRTHTYGDNDLHDNVGYNPWAGTTVRGWPETVILRGEPIVENGTIVAQPGNGQWLRRTDIGVTPRGEPAPEITYLESHS